MFYVARTQGFGLSHGSIRNVVKGIGKKVGIDKKVDIGKKVGEVGEVGEVRLEFMPFRIRPNDRCAGSTIRGVDVRNVLDTVPRQSEDLRGFGQNFLGPWCKCS